MRDYQRKDPREDKLPMWARTTIASMRNEIRNLEKLVNEVSVDGSNTTLDGDPTSKIREVGLGESPRINFYLGEGRRSVDCVQIYIDLQGKLTIQGNSTLIVRPKATNSLTIDQEDRF